MRAEKLSTAKKLLALNIPYIVGVASFKMRGTGENGGIDYFFAAPESYKCELNEKAGFFNQKNSHNWLVEKTMNSEDISEFRKDKAKYNLVFSSESGRVYEHKSHSVKDYFYKNDYKNTKNK
jgi:hypothetical protein